MKKLIIQITAIVVIISIMFNLSGCLKDFDVSRLIEDPLEYEAPEMIDWEEKIYPSEVKGEFEDAYMYINPAFGDKLEIQGMEYAIQLIMQASKDPNRIVDINPPRRGYENDLEIYNKNDELLGTFEISSDFMLYARVDKSSPLFLFPEYAYYTIEHSLLQYGASLVAPLEDWERLPPLGDERAKYVEKALELRLAHDVKTVIVQKYGVSEAYFLNYKIYTTAEYVLSSSLTVRVYALVGYAGYSNTNEDLCEIHLESTDIDAIEECKDCGKFFFSPDYHIETAAKLVYSLVDAKYYRLTNYSEPAKYNEELPSSLESRIRAIFPFEHMKDVMTALDDTSNIHLDIHRQALDYLRISGQGELEIDD